MFTDILKDNSYVKKALVTGILIVAKESIFSGLNNLEVDKLVKYFNANEDMSRFGRYDVMIIPKDTSKYGIIIEFKKIDELSKESIEEATEKALKQIDDKKYESELLERGIKNIIKLAIVFKNKEVEITEG